MIKIRGWMKVAGLALLILGGAFVAAVLIVTDVRLLLRESISTQPARATDNCTEFREKALKSVRNAEDARDVFIVTAFATKSVAYSLLYQNCLRPQ